MTKDKIKTAQRLQQKITKMHYSLKKHFGQAHLNTLQNNNAWEWLADSERLSDTSITGLTQLIKQVNIQLIPKCTAVRALYIGVDEAPVDQLTKDGFHNRLANMVDNLKSHSSYEVIFETAMGGKPFPINPESAILMLEKMALGLHTDKEAEEE